jgi:FkbM family methyltransferase
MDTLQNIKTFLNNNSSTSQNFIEAIKQFEIQEGYPNTAIRDKVTGPLCDEFFTGQTFIKELQNGLKIKFSYNSKIAREFLLCNPTVPNHVWEPQTTKLLLHFSQQAKVVIIAGAYFGDQAIPIANNIKNTGTCYTFEPNTGNSNLIIENAQINNLNNIVINNLALWNKPDVYLTFEGADALASTIEKTDGTDADLKTTTIDNFISQENIEALNLLMIDVEGSETKVLQGAEQSIEKYKPVIVFETHSLYDDWSNGLENSASVLLLKKYDYSIFAVREYHQNIEVGNMPIELLPLNKTFCDTPPHHGFNMLAVPNQNLINNPLFKIVENLSPKLISTKQEALFKPSL